MLKINSNSLISGYIKQLLSEFNLPKAKVMKKGMTLFKDGYYIGNGNLFKATETCTYGTDFNDPSSANGLLHRISAYIYGKPYLNITKNLEMSSSLYDTYTHNYLGDYLRFQRDYKGINLMSMYNCFSGEIAHNIDRTISITDNVTTVFKSDDGEHIIYMVPVKFGCNYTIAIDCEGAVEMAGCFYAANQLTQLSGGLNQALSDATYSKEEGARFNAPFVYGRLKDVLARLSTSADTLYAHEKNLKLMIKVPVKNKSSIVVLEGDYRAAAEQSLLTDFSWDDHKDDRGEPALIVTNWYTLNPSTGVFDKVIDGETAYYLSGDNEPKWYLKRGETYKVGSPTSSTTVTIADNVKYYSSNIAKDSVNFFVSDATRRVLYFLHRDDFPEHPTSSDINCVFFDEEYGLGYLWNADSSEYELIKEAIKGNQYERTYSSRMQLLYVNDGNKYMFADKLISYLLDNVITSDDQLSDNIRRLQKTFYYRKNPSSKPDYDPARDTALPIGYDHMPKHAGIWSQDLRDMTYDLLNRYGVLSVSFDVIGFVDKDAEKLLGDDLSYDKKGHVISGGIS